jgi:glyoxylase-like metal-dependent hydrolase (beta-lactamase superfamily II)
VTELVEDRNDMTVRRAFVSEMNNAVYLLTSKQTGHQILIDAADDEAALLDLITSASADVREGVETSLDLIVTTHSHWDHTRATKALRNTTGAHVLIGADDAEELYESRSVEADETVDDGDAVNVPGISLRVIALRGHTPGSIALATTSADPAMIFTGDSLFPGGVGNTNNDPERFASLITDVTERIFDRYSDDTAVYPGHGEATTLGAERPHLEQWRSRGW